MAPSAAETAVIERLRSEQDAMEALLIELVNQNSATDHFDGVNLVGRQVERFLLGLGMRTSAFVTGRSGQHLIARSATRDGNRLMLLGHLDTVYPNVAPIGRYAVDPENAARALGPGVTDMKGGIVVMLFAVRALVESGALQGRALTVLLTADEESGSVTSHDLVADEAPEHHLTLVFETGSPRPEGRSTIVIERRGYARYTVEVAGVEAHAGNAKARGVSAALEAAHLTIALEALNDLERGRAVNVGVLHAGSAANTVPGRARLEIDVRFKTAEDGRRLDAEIEALCRTVKTQSLDGSGRPSIELKKGPWCPPLEPTDASRRMAQRIVGYAAEIGQTLELEYRGGASDGNITAHAGCPTVDGLGTIGAEIHSPGEWVERRSLSERAALLALTMMRFYAL